MKPAHSNIASSSGFSLIEVIATIIVVGILAAFFIHFMGTALSDSYKSVELVAGEAEGEGTLEQIIADYVKEINFNPDDALASIVTNNAGGAYGSNVSMVYIGFDVNGNEIPAPSGTINKGREQR